MPVLRLTMPTGEAFPQECARCGMCGHKASTHARFVKLFPEIEACRVKQWTVNEIQHRCLWCNPQNRNRWNARVRSLRAAGVVRPTIQTDA